MPMTPSMRPDNFYSFACPQTGKLERYIACMLRRYKHWRGEKIEPICATCMNAGKCPALKMLDREWREDKAVYFDPTPGRARKLPDDVLAHIATKSVCAIHAFGTGIDQATLSRLMERQVSNEVFAGVERNVIVAEHPQGIGDWDAKPKAKPDASRKRAKPADKDPASMLDAVAAVSTDMAGAINEAMRNEGL